MVEQENSNTGTPETVEKTNPFSKVAEVLAAQTATSGESNFENFKPEPFFPEEKEEKQEEKAEVKTDTIINKEEEKVEAPVETKEEAKKEITTEEILSYLNSSLNEPIGSVEEIKSLIEENKKYKQAENELRGLTKEDRARLEVGQEYGDYGLYDRVISLDATKLSPKEALKQVFYLEHNGKNPEFIEKAFQKDFSKKYEDETDEEFSKLSLENNGQEAIQKLIDLQEQFKELGKVSGGTDPEQVQRLKEEEDQKWFASVDNVLNKNNQVSYELEDGLKINIVMDGKDKIVIQNYMDNPIEFLKAMITDEKGAYDHEALYEFVMRNVYQKHLLEEARKSGAAHREEKILKEKKNTVIDTGKAGDPVTQSTTSDEMAKNFRSLISQY